MCRCEAATTNTAYTNQLVKGRPLLHPVMRQTHLASLRSQNLEWCRQNELLTRLPYLRSCIRTSRQTRKSLLAGVGTALLTRADDRINKTTIILETHCGTTARLLRLFLGSYFGCLTTHFTSTCERTVDLTCRNGTKRAKERIALVSEVLQACPWLTIVSAQRLTHCETKAEYGVMG